MSQPPTESTASSLIPWQPRGLDGWVFESVALEDDERCLLARLRRRGTREFLEIRVTPLNDRVPSFQRLQHVQVAYRGSVTDRSEETRAAIRELILGVAGSVDALYGIAPELGLPAALGRSAEPRQLVFGRDGLLSLFAPHFRPGDEIVGGWSLSDAYPSQQVKGLKCEEPTMVLDFRHPQGGRQVLMTVSERHPDSVAHVLSAHFCLSVLAGFGNPQGSETLQSLVAFALQLQDHAGLEWEFPAQLEYVMEAPRLQLSAADLANPAGLLGDGGNGDGEMVREGEELNLAILSECGQGCAFCSVKETTPAQDGGEETFQRLAQDLVENRRRGVRRVRFNGYDPLSFSRILDLMRLATGLGYEETHVFSPCTRLADPEFCTEVMRALPPGGAHFYPPVYSLEDAVHDRVVGRPGALALVRQAIDNLRVLVEPARIHILTVLTKENLGSVAGVIEWAMEQGFEYHGHTQYPSFESRGDRYYSSAPRVSEAARAVVPLAKKRGGVRIVRKVLEGVAPCVVFREMTAQNVAPKRWLDATVKPGLPGTDYRDERYRHTEGDQAFEAVAVGCPHIGECSLAPACPGEILRAYVDLYGFEEFRAVSLAELLFAT